MDTIHTLFKEMKESWENKKKEEIMPLYTGQIELTIQKLTYTLESIVKKIMKKVECDALSSISFAHEFDAKLQKFSQQLKNVGTSQNRIQDYKKLFDELSLLDEEWKKFEPSIPDVKIQYNPFEIQNKINECIKISSTQLKEQEVKLPTSTKLFGSQDRALELTLNREIKSTSDKERQDQSELDDLSDK